jgi:hypothetical protein
MVGFILCYCWFSFDFGDDSVNRSNRSDEAAFLRVPKTKPGRPASARGISGGTGGVAGCDPTWPPACIKAGMLLPRVVAHPADCLVTRIY